MKLPALLLAAVCLLYADENIVFTKAFPGSTPAYCSLKILRTGDLEYKESPTDDNPIRAQLPRAEVDPLFAMASKLGYFKGNLESGLKVANTGKKTFHYEDAAGAASEAVFNYSTDVTAQQLLDRFEQIAESERAFIDLDRTVHFDKLGVNDSLSLIESLWLHKTLAAPAQFVPLLTRIAGHTAFMHLVRDRAARLKDQFLAETSTAAAAHSSPAP
jgi:hypothetical protein